jgi:pyruvate/2-oxoglutarate dehydrogenase complex dihydrolipoamide dehydrogenase (E3) component
LITRQQSASRSFWDFPSAFTDPELAHIGLSENEAQRQRIPYRLFKIPMDANLLPARSQRRAVL